MSNIYLIDKKMSNEMKLALIEVEIINMETSEPK